MGERKSKSSPAPGPDLLGRYLQAYLASRQMRDVERPWGLGDDALDGLWARLIDAHNSSDTAALNEIIATRLSGDDRLHIMETLAPLIFALPLRTYPAELRAERHGARLELTLRHLAAAGKTGSTQPAPQDERLDAAERPSQRCEKTGDDVEQIGYLPAALTGVLELYLRRLFKWAEEKRRSDVTISTGGRRRRVRITLLAHGRGVVIRFLARLASPADAA